MNPDPEAAPERLTTDTPQRADDLLRALFEQAYQYMGLLDTHGRVLEMNGPALNFIGRRREEVIGRPLEDCALHSKGEAVRARFRAAVERAARGTFIRYEVDVADAEGRPVVLDFSLKPVVGEDGAVTLLVAEGRDVTEQKRAQHTLREQEALLRTIVENLPVVIYAADRDGTFRLSEGRGLERLQDRPSAVGQSMYERYRDAPEILEPLRRTLAGAEERFTNRIQGVAYEDRTAPLRDEHGEVVGLVGVSVDVTEREARARALRESEARLRSLVENTPVVLFVLDPAGVFTCSEGRGLASLGLAPGEVVGRSVFDLYADLPEGLAHIRRALAGEPAEWTIAFEGVHLETRVKPILDEAGAMVEVIGVAYDVSERVEAAAALDEARCRAEEANRMKSAFLANMSHEIRTPLTSILGFAELLADDIPPEHNDVPGLIMKGGQRLMNTLNSVLDLARIEDAQMGVRLVPVDVVAEATETVRLLRPLAERKGLRLEVRTLAPPGPVQADSAALDRVVTNLVSNAIKFTREGAVVVEVGVDGADGLIRVRDTGQGIDAAFLPYLFDAFRQESDGFERQHEGSGLGLAISRRLVELMGGTLSAESRKGEGSTFTVRLPRLSEGGDGSVVPAAHSSLAEAVRVRRAG